MELRAQQASGERDTAASDRDAAAVEHERIREELAGRAQAEEEVRRRLGEQRAQVRQWEQELQTRAQTRSRRKARSSSVMPSTGSRPTI